jgi:hypothetical protein
MSKKPTEPTQNSSTPRLPQCDHDCSHVVSAFDSQAVEKVTICTQHHRPQIPCLFQGKLVGRPAPAISSRTRSGRGYGEVLPQTSESFRPKEKSRNILVGRALEVAKVRGILQNCSDVVSAQDGIIFEQHFHGIPCGERAQEGGNQNTRSPDHGLPMANSWIQTDSGTHKEKLRRTQRPVNGTAHGGVSPIAL